jgi:hypothetical protein
MQVRHVNLLCFASNFCFSDKAICSLNKDSSKDFSKSLNNFLSFIILGF